MLILASKEKSVKHKLPSTSVTNEPPSRTAFKLGWSKEEVQTAIKILRRD